MTTNIDLARQVSKHVDLEMVSLKEAEIQSNLDPLNLPDEIGMSQGHRCDFEIKEEDSGRIRLNVNAYFKFDASRLEQGEEAEELMSLTATFLLVYYLAEKLEVDSRCFQYFSDLNGPYNAWPYWRELVQTATGRVGLSGVIVPLFRPQAREVESLERSSGNAGSDRS